MVKLINNRLIKLFFVKKFSLSFKMFLMFFYFWGACPHTGEFSEVFLAFVSWGRGLPPFQLIFGQGADGARGRRWCRTWFVHWFVFFLFDVSVCGPALRAVVVDGYVCSRVAIQWFGRGHYGMGNEGNGQPVVSFPMIRLEK